MNQILITENKKKKKGSNGKPIEIKGIVRFFAVATMIFGFVFVGEGSYAIFRNTNNKDMGKAPVVTIARENDQAIVNIQHDVEITKITYSWDNGEETIVPINDVTAQESITLLGYDSILNLVVEDINGRQVTYQKQYYLNDVDITKPTIEISTQDGNDKLTITAKDETSIAYITYGWEGEETTYAEAESENQTEIVREVTLTPGTKKLRVIAEDMNGNVEEIEKEIVTSTSKPEMILTRLDGGKFTLQAKDEDGVKEIVINLNGERYSIGDLNTKDITVGPLQLREGNNTIAIEVTNISGYTEKATTELQY